MNKFYSLRDEYKRGALYLTSDTKINGYRFLKGEEIIQSPIEFRKNIGKNLYDFTIGGQVGVLLFHNRFFESLRHNGITGFDSVSTIINLNKIPNYNYSCLIVNGRAGYEDVKKGEIINRGPYVPGAPDNIIKKGIYFDESTWDGSDFFLIEERLYIFVTERVKRIIDELKLTNVKLIPSDEEERDIELLARDNPELMSFYMNQLKK